jgi:glucose dehydrogenase
MRNTMWMRRRWFAGAVFVVVSAVSAQQPNRVDTNALKNAAKNGDEWVTYGRDYAETHYSPLKQIDTTNVSRLGLAWSWETDRPAVEEWKARR